MLGMKKLSYKSSISFLILFMACFYGGWNCSNKGRNINMETSVTEVRSASNSPRAHILNVLIEGQGPYSWKQNYDSFNVVFLKHDQTRHLGINFGAT